jgi:hypothetical protein
MAAAGNNTHLIALAVAGVLLLFYSVTSPRTTVSSYLR